jgi:RND family efflux transporter MFP subunit
MGHLSEATMQRFAADRLSLLFTLATLVAASGCEHEIAKLEPTPPPTVTISQPIPREISDEAEFTGHTDAVGGVEVRARVNGFIDEVAFTDGAIVTEDDLLFQIDPRPFDAEVDRCKAALAVAKARAKRAVADLERAEKLIKGKTISQEEYDQTFANEAESSASVKQAEASLTTANLNREYSTVTAPIAGRVSRAMITKGNLVNSTAGSATLLTTIVPVDPIYAYFDVDEPMLLRHARNARDSSRPPIPVEMELANETNFPHQGKIDFIDNRIDSATGTIRVRAVFPNPDGTLTPGLFARVRIHSAQKRPALLVNDRAVGVDQGRKYLLVVGGDNKVEYREVLAGPLVDGLRAIENGLKADEWVIVNGLQRARPGITVETEKTKMPVPAEAGAETEQETIESEKQASAP